MRRKFSNSIYTNSRSTDPWLLLVVILLLLFFGEKCRKKGGQKGKTPKKEKNKNEFGLVVSQADPDSESGRTQLGNSEKEKKTKRIWPRRVPTDPDSESGRTQLHQK